MALKSEFIFPNATYLRAKKLTMGLTTSTPTETTKATETTEPDSEEVGSLSESESSETEVKGTPSDANTEDLEDGGSPPGQARPLKSSQRVRGVSYADVAGDPPVQSKLHTFLNQPLQRELTSVPGIGPATAKVLQKDTQLATTYGLLALYFMWYSPNAPKQFEDALVQLGVHRVHARTIGNALTLRLTDCGLIQA